MLHDDMTVAEVVALLGLQPHPEGGFYKETFRDVVADANGRAASTAIYYLLGVGEVSEWHRVDAAE
ncbi:MAG: cupin domain-containing protein, partial [Bosea sp. (in: a-proteobacteria)]